MGLTGLEFRMTRDLGPNTLEEIQGLLDQIIEKKEMIRGYPGLT